MSLSTLLNELKCIIISLLSLNTRKDLRLTDREFSTLVKPYMIHRVYISSRKPVLDRLLDIAYDEVFANAVTTVQFGFLMLHNILSHKEYITALRIDEDLEYRGEDLEDRDKGKLDKEKLDNNSYIQLLSMYEDQNKVTSTREDLACVTKVFRHLPNVKHVEFKPKDWHYLYEYSEISPYIV